MQNFANLVLWIYIVLLVVGGLIGFLKAKSQVSLIMSVSFAALLSLCAAHIVFQYYVADILLAALLVVVAIDVDPHSRRPGVAPHSLAYSPVEHSPLSCLKPPYPFGKSIRRLSITAK